MHKKTNKILRKNKRGSVELKDGPHRTRSTLMRGNYMELHAHLVVSYISYFVYYRSI